MNAKTLRILLCIAAVTLVVTFTGCIDTGDPEVTAMPDNPGANQDGATPASSPGSSSATERQLQTAVCESSQILTPLAAWWNPQWSDDGQKLDVAYTRGRNTLTERIHVGASYTSSGEPIQGSEVTYRKGEDIYGRVQNMTIGHFAGWHGTLKPESAIAYGTFIYPAQVAYENGWFTRELNVTIASEFNNEGRLSGGSGTETFSGHLKTAEGILRYSGSATATFSVKNGVLLWTDRVEKTTYSFGREPYAETVTVVTPESEYLGGGYVKVRETVRTTTRYADGSSRESEIVLVWQRNAAGLTSGRSGSGTVSGTEIVNGESINYAGEITLDYGFDTRIGWFKTGYREERSAEAALPERLPFELISIDDLYLRPVF